MTMTHEVAAESDTDRPRTRVLVVDDHHTFADLLAIVLSGEADFECVGKAGSASSAIRMAHKLRPDIIVMDIQLGSDSGLEVTRRLREELPDAVIVVVSAHRDPSWLARASQAGASAFVPKSGSLDEMLSVLRSARNGSMIVAPSLFQDDAPVPVATDEPVDKLTPRERDVLVLMGQGASPREIARILNISINTCRGYVKVVHAKLGVRSQLEAVVKAQRLGIIGMADED